MASSCITYCANKFHIDGDHQEVKRSLKKSDKELHVAISSIILI